MSTVREQLAITVRSDGRIYAFGGDDGSNTLNTAEAAQPVLHRSWIEADTGADPEACNTTRGRLLEDLPLLPADTRGASVLTGTADS
jgi:Kelch motif